MLTAGKHVELKAHLKQVKDAAIKRGEIVMNNVFVFGSNESGIHGAGAALAAKMKHGAVQGVGFGFTGNSFAIPTKDWRINTMDIEDVKFYVRRFLKIAAEVQDDGSTIQFQVTRIGCGFAGFKDEDIAPLFKDAPANCKFDTAWKPWLGEGKQYWGTF